MNNKVFLEFLKENIMIETNEGIYLDISITLDHLKLQNRIITYKLIEKEKTYEISIKINKTNQAKYLENHYIRSLFSELYEILCFDYLNYIIREKNDDDSMMYMWLTATCETKGYFFIITFIWSETD